MFLSLPLLAKADTEEEACDAGVLAAELDESSPQAAAGAFSALAACDPDGARKAAPGAFARILSGQDGYQAARSAIQVGASDTAVGWIDGLRSDERAQAVKTLGEACNEVEAIQVFFVERAATLGDDFWTQRWYRALASCHTSSIQGVLSAQLDKGVGADRSRFFGVLETYARSAGATSVQRLSELATATDDPEGQSYIVAAFADAAQVGSLEGMNLETAGMAVEAIEAVAPGLTAKALEQGRITLITLGDEAAADGLAAVRFKDLAQEDGSFLWGALVVENAVCKNGKSVQRVHFSDVNEGGMTWPDQLEDKVQATVDLSWALDLAARCKGEGETHLHVPSTPFLDKAAYKAWVKETTRKAENEAVKRPVKMEHETLQI